MRALRYGLVIAVVLLVVATDVCFVVLEDSPLVPADRPINTHDLNRAERLIRRIEYALAGIGDSTTVSASEADLDSLAMLVAHSADGLAGGVRTTPETVRFMGTYDVLGNPFGLYVNVALTVRRSQTGLDVAALDLGHIHLGPRLARFAVDTALSHVLGAKLRDDLLNSLEALTIDRDVVDLAIRPDPTIEERLKARVTAATSDARPAIVAVYYRQIMEIAKTQDHVHQVPIVDFLQPLLATAQARSARSDPVTEARGVVFALAAYFGGRRLEGMRGGLLPPDLARMPEPDSDYVVLRGHHDHLQHFIVSAAFTLSGGVGFTTTIGEAKELDDLRRGGEDFSFQDLAADRAGIDFARVAETPEGARHLESLGRQPASEDLFFPDVSDLPDSMSPARFNAVYHDMTSDAFKAVIADIDRRIQTCAAYKPAS
jgi:hypothetical protein